MPKYVYNFYVSPKGRSFHNDNSWKTISRAQVEDLIKDRYGDGALGFLMEQLEKGHTVGLGTRDTDTHFKATRHLEKDDPW